MIEWIIGILMVLGSLFMLLAAVGILRLPDLPTRMHASTKAGAMGAIFIMTAVVFHFSTGIVLARALAIVLFIIMTAPIAAHVIARAGYFVGVPLWRGTVKDELRDHYDPISHSLDHEELTTLTAKQKKSSS